MSAPRDRATAPPSTTTDKLREIESMAASALAAAEDMCEALDAGAFDAGHADVREAAQALRSVAETACEKAGDALDRAEGRRRPCSVSGEAR